MFIDEEKSRSDVPDKYNMSWGVVNKEVRDYDRKITSNGMNWNDCSTGGSTAVCQFTSNFIQIHCYWLQQKFAPKQFTRNGPIKRTISTNWTEGASEQSIGFYLFDTEQTIVSKCKSIIIRFQTYYVHIYAPDKILTLLIQIAAGDDSNSISAKKPADSNRNQTSIG